MSKIFPWIIVALVVASCALSEEKQTEIKEPDAMPVTVQPREPKYTQEDFTKAENEFKEYFALNFGQTSWYGDVRSYGISGDTTGKVVMGIIMSHEKAYEHLQMPITLWIANYAQVEITELWFLHEGKLVHSVKW